MLAKAGNAALNIARVLGIDESEVRQICADYRIPVR